jgi:lysophospholipase L1-like esterase
VPVAPVKIQLFGDSTMFGQNASGGPRASIYPELALQRLMDNRFGVGAVKVSTRAVSGTASSNLLAGTDNLNSPWPQSVNANIVVINHGINDLRYSVPIATYRSNLQKLAVAPARVVFQTPFPIYTLGTPSAAYAEVMRSVASERGVPLIDAMAYLLPYPGWHTEYAIDGIHATAAGYELVATNVQFPVLSKLVAPLLCK